MITLKVTDEFNSLLQGLKGFTGPEMTEIVVRTLNTAAKDAPAAIKKEMKSVFSNPTPYTLNSIQVTYAKTNKLFSAIAINEYGGKGTAQDDYLRPQVKGGPRQRKRSEKILMTLQAGGKNLFLTPGPGARLNQYGNIPASKYVEVLSYFKSFNMAGYTMNRSKASTKKKAIANKFMMVVEGDSKTAHLSPGIYERTARGRQKIFNFSKQPVYKPRFDFYRVGIEHAALKFRENFNYQVQKIVDRITQGVK